MGEWMAGIVEDLKREAIVLPVEPFTGGRSRHGRPPLGLITEPPEGHVVVVDAS